MSVDLAWIHESPAYWDAEKARIVGGAPREAFPSGWTDHRVGDVLGGDWWRVEAHGEVLGYGFMDVTWGDAEVLLAVAPEARKRGIGSFILERLEHEAAARELNYLYNVVAPSHPDHDAVTAWLEARSFMTSEDGLLKRAVVRPAAKLG